MSAICSTVSSITGGDVDRLADDRLERRFACGVIASAVSNTCSQSRLARPSPWIVSGWSQSAWMMKRGMTFSGCWYGP